MDLDGKAQEVEANGLLATVLQHEIDHTNGILFIDHISKLKRDRVIKKFTKAAKLGKPAIRSGCIRLNWTGCPRKSIISIICTARST